MLTADEVYESVVKHLTTNEQLRLVELIARDLATLADPQDRSIFGTQYVAAPEGRPEGGRPRAGRGGATPGAQGRSTIKAPAGRRNRP